MMSAFNDNKDIGYAGHLGLIVYSVSIGPFLLLNQLLFVQFLLPVFLYAVAMTPRPTCNPRVSVRTLYARACAYAHACASI